MGGITETWRSSSVLIHAFEAHNKYYSSISLNLLFFFLLQFSAPEFDVKEIETLFSAVVPKSNKDKSGGKQKAAGSKPDKVHLVM